MATSNGLKTWFKTPYGVLCWLSTTNMHCEESLTGVESVNNSIDLLSTENRLVMSTPGTKSLPLQSFRLLHLQDIEDMLLLLVQGKLTNLTIEERLALNVSLQMFTISIIIQRRVEDLQLGVESYQKKLNLTRPDTYRSDLKILLTYSAYPNPRGFIYQNKDKKNKLIRIDKLHKFNDGTLNDVRTALDDILKRIGMKYMPQTYWKKVDKDIAGAMIQSIDKMLKNRRIMWSLEKFVGGRPFYTSAGNPVKEILFKLNLLDHRILKDGGEGT
ncbi:hypothetical protein Tco_0344768 [Tanacetum coccineum]